MGCIGVVRRTKRQMFKDVSIAANTNLARCKYHRHADMLIPMPSSALQTRRAVWKNVEACVWMRRSTNHEHVLWDIYVQTLFCSIYISRKHSITSQSKRPRHAGECNLQPKNTRSFLSLTTEACRQVQPATKNCQCLQASFWYFRHIAVNIFLGRNEVECLYFFE